MVDFYRFGMRLAKGLCVTSDEGKNYNEIGELRRKETISQGGRTQFSSVYTEFRIIF